MSIVNLARDLGLSISTVSRALNGYDDVAPETKERVFKRAREIGYRPNPGARRLITPYVYYPTYGVSARI
jgi:LacI family transcriptional regulator